MSVSKMRKRGSFLWVGFGLIVLGLCLISSGPAAAAPKGKVVVLSTAPFSMVGGDCHTIKSATAQGIKALLYDGLVTAGKDGEIEPALAKSWKIGPDWSSITFNLDETAKFHNGEPVTAEDVKFSIERAMKPEMKFNLAGEVKRKIESIEVKDKHTVILHLKEPYPAFFFRTNAFLGIVPKKYVEQVGDKEFAQKPIGAGPYKLVGFKQDVWMEVEAVADHYRKVPNVKTVLYKVVREPATRVAMMKTGEADISQLSITSIKDIEKDPNLTLIYSKEAWPASIMFYDLAHKDRKSPFHDPRVRQAVSYGINRKAISEKVMHGATTPWGDILAPYHPGFDPNIKPDPYDPEKAKALLKEAGYPNGFETTISCMPPHKIHAEAAAASLRSIGIRTKVNAPELMTFIRYTFGKKLSGLGIYPAPFWSGITHPGVSLESFLSSQNKFSYYSPPEVDAALFKLSAAIDEKDIADQARALSKLYRDLRIRAILWAFNYPYALGPRIKKWENTGGCSYPTRLEFLELKN